MPHDQSNTVPILNVKSHEGTRGGQGHIYTEQGGVGQPSRSQRRAEPGAITKAKENHPQEHAEYSDLCQRQDACERQSPQEEQEHSG